MYDVGPQLLCLADGAMELVALTVQNRDGVIGTVVVSMMLVSVSLPPDAALYSYR